MIQRVKTVIKWQDSDGCILGAIREQDIDLPSWGKRQFLRDEINRFIVSLCWDNHQIGKPERFKEYALKAFKPSQIVSVKSRTKGSFVSFKDESLRHFMETNKLL